MWQKRGNRGIIGGRLGGGKRKADKRALPDVAVERDVAAMRLDKCLRNGQPKPSARTAARITLARLADAIKAFKHARVLGFGNARAAILHRDRYLILGRCDADVNGLTGRRI